MHTCFMASYASLFTIISTVLKFFVLLKVELLALCGFNIIYIDGTIRQDMHACMHTYIFIVFSQGTQ